MTNAENMGLGAVLTDPATSNAIQVPVLSIFGAQDLLFSTPGGVAQAQAEHGFFGGAPSHQTIVVPDAGHSLQLSKEAAYANARIFQWINRTVGLASVGDRIVRGGPGGDVLAGDDRGNVLAGGSGDDTLVAGRGNDVLIDGGGANTFLFGERTGQSTILDFRGQQGDRVAVSTPLTWTVEDDGLLGTTIRFSDDGRVLLADVAAALFDPSWIVRTYPTARATRSRSRRTAPSTAASPEAAWSFWAAWSVTAALADVGLPAYHADGRKACCLCCREAVTYGRPRCQLPNAQPLTRWWWAGPSGPGAIAH